jgi:hypothetical protein
MLGIGLLARDTGLDQPGQALLEDVAGDTETPLEGIEPGDAEEVVAQDQHAPPSAPRS